MYIVIRRRRYYISVPAVALILACFLAGRSIARCLPARVAPLRTPTPRPAMASLPPSSPRAPTATARPLPTATATPTPPAPTPLPPPVHVLSTYPIDGDTDVRPRAPLRIVFDQPMDQGPGAVSVTISPSISLRAEWPAPDSLVLQAPPWQPGVEYRLVLQRARGASGGELENPLTLTFGRGGDGAPIPILMYHHIEELDASASWVRRDLTVSPAQLAAQMDLLARLGAHVVPLPQVVGYLSRGEPLPARPVALTFDDGYKSVYANAVPILRARGLPATVFIIMNAPGHSAFMDWPEIKELAAAGFTVGAHSFDHIDVRALTRYQAERQFDEARRLLEGKIGRPVDLFAYPGGWCSEGAARQLAAYGYRAAVGVAPQVRQKPSRLFNLVRIHVGYGASLEALQSKLPWPQGRPEGR